MKHLFNKWQVIFFCLTLALVAISCQNEGELKTSSQKRIVMTSNINWREIPYEDLDENYFQAMCAERPELYEIPRYMSEQETDSVIDVLTNMTATEFQEWYQAYPHHNATFDSYLYFETKIDDISNSLFGVDADSLDVINNASELELLSSTFIEELEVDTTAPYAIIYTTSGKTIYRTIDYITLKSLANSSGFLIIEYELYMFFDNNILITMPLTTYMEIPAFTYNVDVISEFRDFMEYYGFDEENRDYSITILPDLIPTSPLEDEPSTVTDPVINRNATLFINDDQNDYHFMAYSDDGLYGSFVRIYSYEQHKCFNNHRYAILFVENYTFPQNSSKGVSTKRVKVIADASCETAGSTYTGRQWPCTMHIDRKFRSYSDKYDIRFNKHDPIDPVVVLTNVHVNMNWDGNSVEIHY